MISDDERERTIRFIAERRCENGGYCHYRLDEPGAADTFFALDTLRLLGAIEHDPATGAFLVRMQRDDGGFGTFHTGVCVLRSCAIIGLEPASDPRPWLRSFDPIPSGAERPVESVSVFERTWLSLDLYSRLGIGIVEPLRDEVLSLVRTLHHPDGGFGHKSSTMIETWHALAILGRIGEPHSSFRVARFLRRCEHPDFGYLGVPGSTPSFLEHVAAGVECAVLAGLPPRFLEACREFVRRCRNANGGYSRSTFGGISTLENTWLAIRALACLESICDTNGDTHDRN